MDLSKQMEQLAAQAVQNIKARETTNSLTNDYYENESNLITSYFDVNMQNLIPYKTELETSIIKWFASIYDSVEPTVTIKGFQKEILHKHLKNIEWQRKNYKGAIEAQQNGKAAYFLFKEDNSINITSCQIIDEVTINEKIVAITISNGIDFVYASSRYKHIWTFVLNENNIYYKTYWVNSSGIPILEELINNLYDQYNLTRIDKPELLYENANEIFCVVKRSNNYLDEPTCAPVQQKLIQAANYDAVITNLALWDMGTYVEASSAVDGLRKDKEVINSILNEKYRKLDARTPELEAIGIDGLARYIQPNSTQQTTLNSYKELIKQIKQTLGIPSLDDAKSAQQTQAEVVAQNFLSSPNLEQTRLMYQRFLQHLYKNYIIVAKRNAITDFNNVNEEELDVEVEFEFTTLNTANNVQNNNQEQKQDTKETEEVENGKQQ